jgi:RIO-like serine/threonine protein kinase
MKDWTAKQYNMAPIYVIMAHAHRQQALTQQHCFQRFKEAFPVIEMEMRRLVTKYGLLHEDLNMHNVLFSQALTEAVFVDWGLYSRQKVCITTWMPPER